MDYKVRDEIICYIDYAVGAIPRCTKDEHITYNIEYSLVLVLQKNATTSIRTTSFYHNFAKSMLPQIFKTEKDDDGFTTVSGREKPPTNPPAPKTSNKQHGFDKKALGQILDSHIPLSNFSAKKYCAVLWGRGGRGGVGVHPWWGEAGGKFLTQQVSGSRYKSFDTYMKKP